MSVMETMRWGGGVTARGGEHDRHLFPPQRTWPLLEK